ncbi:MAG: rhomboid family intramembrane serine protease [Bdellovibrionales bacterium]
MIIPFYAGFPKIKEKPITWALVLTNVLVFAATINFQMFGDMEIAEKFDREFMVVQGKFFSQFIKSNSDYYDDVHHQLANLTQEGKREKAEILGHFALRDSYFRELALGYSFQGDQVELEYWRSNFSQILNLYNEHPSFRWGVSSLSHEWYHWVSYMFMHGGFWHLLGNLWFLLIVGGALEGIIGGLSYLVLYLGSGVLAAFTYVFFSGVTAVPLIGASGAISCLVAFYSIIRWKRKLRFFYWIIPVQPYMGFINLPAWVGFMYWFLGDLAGFLGQMSSLGGVAYSAHLGGTSVGIICGGLLYWSKKHGKGLYGYSKRVEPYELVSSSK